MHLERGVSLLELLIACTVLSVALLGLGLLSTRALQDSGTLRDHALAELLIADLKARVTLVGHEQLESYTHDPVRTPLTYQNWQAQAASLLPSLRSSLCRNGSSPAADPRFLPCDGSGPLVVQLSWRSHYGDDFEWRQEPIRP